MKTFLTEMSLSMLSKMIPAKIFPRSVGLDKRGQAAARSAPTFLKPVRAAATRGTRAIRDVVAFASADSSVVSKLNS